MQPTCIYMQSVAYRTAARIFFLSYFFLYFFFEILQNKINKWCSCLFVNKYHGFNAIV